MRKSHILLLIFASLVLGLVLWMWPRAASEAISEDSNKTNSILAERKEARRLGNVSTAPSGISGIVYEAESKRAISGAVISLRPRKIDGGMISKPGKSPAPLLVRTDDGGRFRLLDIVAGEFSVSASAEGYKPMAQESLVVEAGSERSDLVFALTTGGYQLRGVVSDIGGGPVPFAQVSATNMSGFTIGTLFRAPFATTSDADGKYQLNLEEGRYQVSVFHPDYRRSQEQVHIAGTDRITDFVLSPGSVVEGVVLRASDDSPVPNALVTMAPQGQGRGFVVSGVAFRGGAQTDDNGRFVLTGQGSGAFEIRAVAKDASSRQPTAIQLSIAENASDVVVYVDDAYSLSGFVVNKNDETQAEPGVLLGAYNFSPGAVFVSESPSAADGYFEIHGVHPGNYTLAAAAEERQPNLFGESVTVKNQDIRDLVISVDPGMTLRGRVTPAKVAQLHIAIPSESLGFGTMLQAAGSVLVNGRSDANGEFELRGVGTGTFTLVAESEDGSKGSLKLTVGSKDLAGLEVAMQERGSAEGIVVDGNGQPVEGTTIKFASGSKAKATMTLRPPPVTVTGPDGRFVHVGLEDGVQRITAHYKNTQLAWANKTGDEAYAPRQIELIDGERLRGIRLDVVARNESIRGMVVDSGGTVVRDAWVTAKYVPDANSAASRWAPAETPVLTDEQGRFEVKELRKGLYDLTAEGLRGGATGAKDEVATGQYVQMKLEALGTLKGRVLSKGNPVSEYVIVAGGPTQRRVPIVNQSGEFEVRGLEAGQYTIEVTSVEGTATNSAEIQAGDETQFTINLAAYGSITGTLLDGITGEPMADISVAASVGKTGKKWAENALDLMQGEGPTTNADGSFTVLRLGAGAGEVYFIDPDAKDFSMIATQGFKLSAGEAKDLGEIRGIKPTTVAPEKEGTLKMETEVGTAAALCPDDKTGADDEGQHLWVVGVERNGPADLAGAKLCDRITSVNGLRVEEVSPLGLRMILGRIEVGRTITIGVVTDSGNTTLSLQPSPSS